MSTTTCMSNKCTFQNFVFKCLLLLKLVDYGIDYYILLWRCIDYRLAFARQIKKPFKYLSGVFCKQKIMQVQSIKWAHPVKSCIQDAK